MPILSRCGKFARRTGFLDSNELCCQLREASVPRHAFCSRGVTSIAGRRTMRKETQNENDRFALGRRANSDS
jgi:hypothetical protein